MKDLLPDAQKEPEAVKEEVILVLVVVENLALTLEQPEAQAPKLKPVLKLLLVSDVKKSWLKEQHRYNKSSQLLSPIRSTVGFKIPHQLGCANRLESM